MFKICTDRYALFLQDHGLPIMADEYSNRASLNEHFESNDDCAEWCYVAVARTGNDWPFMTVAQQFSPAGCGFEPAAILIPETDRLLIGAGEHLLAYDLAAVQRLWEDIADGGFWGWARHGSVVVMSAELELATWDLHGEKLWSTYVEPPWCYSVSNGTVNLDVMGENSSFDLVAGPSVKGS